jgi:hypothetical protein
LDADFDTKLTAVNFASNQLEIKTTTVPTVIVEIA